MFRAVAGKGFFAFLWRTNSLRFACVAMPVSYFPGGVAWHPATRRTRGAKEIAAYATFYRSLHDMHGEGHGTVTLSAKVSALAFKSSGSFRGKNDICRLPLVKLLDPHVQLLND
jgi:hypothetical protein